MDIMKSIQDMGEAVVLKTTAAAELVELRVREAGDRLRATAADVPLECLCGAVAAGFVLAVMINRPKVKILYVREQP
jgi:hypothetical protein